MGVSTKLAGDIQEVDVIIAGGGTAACVVAGRLAEADPNPSNRQNLIDAKDDILGWNSIDISSKFRPTEEDMAALGPEFQAAWNRDFKNAPDRPPMLMGVVSW
ncbi:hypothetical protein AUP68_10749 [Ilyonectria robusta]